MRLILSLLGRLITITFAAFCALFAVLSMFAAGLYFDVIPHFSREEIANSSSRDIYDLFLLFLYIFEMIGVISAKLLNAVGVPFLIAIIASELMQWRSLVSYFLLGAAVSLFAIVSELPQGASLEKGSVTILLALGFTGGLVYWLIAGRRAGAWMKFLNSSRK